MTRINLFAAWTILAGATVFAASLSETTTYVDGNLTGIAPNTGGTLQFSDAKSMNFRAGEQTIDVPYSAISKAELGAVRTNSHDVPFYKVWARHRTQTQFLTVSFNSKGEEKTMTLELAQASAPVVLGTINDHTKTAAGFKPIDPKDSGAKASPPTKAGSDWWGDDIWKTHSNASTWAKPEATTAPQE